MIGEDILRRLADDAIASVDSGYYDVKGQVAGAIDRRRNLVEAFRRNARSLVCEIKFASPSAGKISEHRDVATIASQMESGGATALSVLTEKGSFKGSLENLTRAKAATKTVPVMMKDIVVSGEQIVAASKIGADAVLLILELFENGLTRISLDGAIDLAHNNDLSVVVETYTLEGLKRLVFSTKCDVAGINNRDLTTFQVNVERTVELLRSLGEVERHLKRRPLLMSESGYECSKDVEKVLNALRSSRSSILPDAFLIGTSIMRSGNVEEKVREFSQVIGGGA